jgi:Polyketide cyclase / dehydrase and lipid transport
MQRSHTHSISIDAPVDAVLDLISDATRLPRWAPAFARSVRRDGDAWVAEAAGGEKRIRVRVSREHGTVDYLRAGTPPGVDVGAFARVIPNGGGAEMLFTLFFADGTPERDVEDARAVVAVELQTVRALCERHAQPKAA